MEEITLKINDRQVKGKEGDTVLAVCRANDIYVPTLCHLEGLSDVGACRMCMVEVEGERKPVPACTYPVRNGLVVKTHTEALEKHRRLILELIFTERNHFCMFCEQSGDCELQELAYRYQMDNIRYPYTNPRLPVDSLNDYLVIDHNRCVLCGRCVRACSEVVGIHTLDFGKRGWKTTISADLEQPLGESSCISCGACAQACPTGAIFSKLSLYKGKTSECQQVATVCPLCSVGCELNVLVKDGNLVRIEAPSLEGPRAPLCDRGRFGLLYDERPRITSPLVRDKRGELKERSIGEAIDLATMKLRELKGSIAGIISTRYSNETLSLFHKFMHDVMGSDNIDTLDGKKYRIITEGIRCFRDDGAGLDIECSIEGVLQADCIVVAGADPQRTHPVVGCLIRRAVSQEGAKLIVINSARDVFPLWSNLWLRPEVGSEQILFEGLTKILMDKGLTRRENTPAELAAVLSDCALDEVDRITGVEIRDLEAAVNMYGEAKRGIIIYGDELLDRNAPALVNSLLRLASLTGNQIDEKLGVISLKPYTNSRGGWELGIAAGEIQADNVRGAYLVLDDEQLDEKLVEQLKSLDFIVVQASYQSSATSVADIVLPSPIWSERQGGEYVSLDGRTGKSQQLLQPRKGMLQFEEVLARLTKNLGH